MKTAAMLALLLLPTGAMAWEPEYFPPGSFDTDQKLEAGLGRCAKIDDRGTPEGLAHISDCTTRVVLRGMSDAEAQDEADEASGEKARREAQQEREGGEYDKAAERWRRQMAGGGGAMAGGGK
jgi:hypothetical protein